MKKYTARSIYEGEREEMIKWMLRTGKRWKWYGFVFIDKIFYWQQVINNNG